MPRLRLFYVPFSSPFAGQSCFSPFVHLVVSGASGSAWTSFQAMCVLPFAAGSSRSLPIPLILLKTASANHLLADTKPNTTANRDRSDLAMPLTYMAVV